MEPISVSSRLISTRLWVIPPGKGLMTKYNSKMRIYFWQASHKAHYNIAHYFYNATLVRFKTEFSCCHLNLILYFQMVFFLSEDSYLTFWLIFHSLWKWRFYHTTQWGYWKFWSCSWFQGRQFYSTSVVLCRI